MASVLQRLQFLEQRVAQLEAQAQAALVRRSDSAHVSITTPAGTGRNAAQSSDADSVRPGSGSARPAPAARAPTTIQDPPTQRLEPLPGAAHDPFPDLSQLEEKLERRKGAPQRIDVRAAVESYPRIAKQIEQLWGTPECEHYLNSLVIDTRGNRQGFPPDVLEELLYLGRLARALVILQVGGDLWERYDRIGDRR